ncbi:MAG TPA: SusC/RagA family TonB-linked outer membrane protein [Flavisolibacter sp.]|nr:SusC/RagA family TonB-linked outer membrane protein [Flavisolibacter sp.]
MRKLLYSLFLCAGLMMHLLSIAQDRTITGRVTSSDDNKPLSGVTITVRGSGRKATTDNNGNFTIVARTGDVLEFSFVGRKPSELTVQGNNNIELQLGSKDDVMNEVVVTAMDVKRNPRELGYSVQKVNGAEVQETQRENFLNSLQGRVAGATVNLTGGAAGASSQIVLRGFNSLSLDNSPLFVIDGIIIDNSTLNETSNGGTLLGLASDRANRGNDYSSRISDINPNDIESLTILKGPEATALYGSQASSGAIIITTKKASTAGKLGIAYDNSFRTSKLTRLPHEINLFDGGDNGTPADAFRYFGPAYDSKTTLYDNLNHFFRTGFAQTHNLSLDYGTQQSSYRVSGSIFDQKSPVPTNDYQRYNVRLSNTTKLGKYLDVSPSVSLIRTVNDKPLRGASGYLLNLLAWPSDNDIRDWQTANGLKKPVFASNPNAELDNPFYNVYKNRSADATNRFLGTLAVNYNPFSWLAIAGRFGYDTYKTTGYTRFDSMSFYTTRAQKGYQDNYYRGYYGYNHTITATGRKTIGDLTGRLMVGNMWQNYESQQYAVSGSNLKDMNRTDSSNTDPATRIRLSNALKGLPNYSISRQSAFFGEVSIGWKSSVFLTYSHRFEESSIFPKDFRKYNYPAASLSVIVSDLIPALNRGNILNYLKLRGSLASTARSSAPYANQSVFNQNNGSGGGYYYGFTNSNPLLQPEKQKTFEVGTEWRFIRNRISLDATYYNTKNNNLIVEQFRASYGTGFVLNTLNVGANQNQGVEISLDANIIQGKDFKWTSRVNFSKMWNEVLELPANVPEFYQSDTWLYANARGGLIVGGPTTSITSYGYARNKAGDILVSPSTGLPVLDNNFRVRGDRNPDFAMGFVNTFTYRNLRLSFLWDLKVGGDIFNATERYLTTIGRSIRTADRNNPIIVKGVLQDGLENTATPTKNTIKVVPYYQQTYYTTMPEEEFIEKNVNWFRLRDITLNYTFGTKVMRNMRWVRSLSAFVTGNDLVLFTNYTGADPAVNGNTAGSRGVGGFGFDYGNIGAPVSVNFGIRVNF